MPDFRRDPLHHEVPKPPSGGPLPGRAGTEALASLGRRPRAAYPIWGSTHPDAPRQARCAPPMRPSIGQGPASAQIGQTAVSEARLARGGDPGKAARKPRVTGVRIAQRGAPPGAASPIPRLCRSARWCAPIANRAKSLPHPLPRLRYAPIPIPANCLIYLLGRTRLRVWMLSSSAARLFGCCARRTWRTSPWSGTTAPAYRLDSSIRR